MPKLKVYATRIGFHDAIVAAPNQKAALAAWDVGENLFAQGAAQVTEDPAALKAATAHPGKVLRRAAGSSGGYSEAPGAPAVPELARPKAGKAARGEKAKPRPAPDRGPLDAAEKALSAFEDDIRGRREAIERRRRELDSDAQALDRTIEAERSTLERKRDDARRLYERRGGG